MIIGRKYKSKLLSTFFVPEFEMSDGSYAGIFEDSRRNKTALVLNKENAEHSWALVPEKKTWHYAILRVGNDHPWATKVYDCKETLQNALRINPSTVIHTCTFETEE